MRETDLVKLEFKAFRKVTNERQTFPSSLINAFGLLTIDEIIELMLISKRPANFLKWPVLDEVVLELIRDLNKYISQQLNGSSSAFELQCASSFSQKRNFLFENRHALFFEIKKYFNCKCLLKIDIPANFNISEVKFECLNYDDPPQGYRYYNNFRNNKNFDPTHRMQEGWLFYFEINWMSDCASWRLKELLFDRDEKIRLEDGLQSENIFFKSTINLPTGTFFKDLVELYLISKLYKPIQIANGSLLETKVENISRLLNIQYGIYCLKHLFIEDDEQRIKLQLLKDLSSEIHRMLISNKNKHVFLDCYIDMESQTLNSKFLSFDENEIDDVRYSYVHQDFISYKMNPGGHTWREAFWVYINLRWSNTGDIWKLKQKVLFKSVE
jgi:hypothetical protein